jgi:hypothetical protein
MRAGDAVTDTQGRTWQLGHCLGRGAWGSTWVLTDGRGGELVAKIAHARTDFPPDARLPDGLERACAQCVEEQAAWLKRANHPFLPRLEGRAQLDGRPALLMPRYASSLQKRLAEGAPLRDVVTLLADVAGRVGELHAAGEVHGNLRPSNLLLRDDGEPVITDLLTPTAVEWRARLAALSPRPSVLPPEAGSGMPKPVWDTWALCGALHGASVWSPGGDVTRPDGTFALDKVELAAVRDRAVKRLKADGANSRFVGRASERLTALLSRGLSEETEPSPPYRFPSAEELRQRLVEVGAIAWPRVMSVGKVLLPSTARDGVFVGGEDVAFSVTVELTEGVTGPENLAVGLRLVDLDAPEERRVPIPDAAFDARPHPSGRLRFQFTLPAVAPGRYRVECAFAVKDSGDEPLVAFGELAVRPPPGYVPPLEDELPEAPPLEFDAAKDPVRLDAARFPTPISPTASQPAATAPTAVPGSQADKSVGPDDPTGATAPTSPRVELPRPRPVATVPPPPGRPAPTATLASAATVPNTISGVAASSPSWDQGSWEELPDAAPEEPFVPQPDGVADLPDWTPAAAGPPWWRRALDLASRDSVTAVLVVAAMVLVVVVLITSLLRACSG